MLYTVFITLANWSSDEKKKEQTHKNRRTVTEQPKQNMVLLLKFGHWEKLQKKHPVTTTWRTLSHTHITRSLYLHSQKKIKNKKTCTFSGCSSCLVEETTGNIHKQTTTRCLRAEHRPTQTELSVLPLWFCRTMAHQLFRNLPDFHTGNKKLAFKTRVQCTSVPYGIQAYNLSLCHSNKFPVCKVLRTTVHVKWFYIMPSALFLLVIIVETICLVHKMQGVWPLHIPGSWKFQEEHKHRTETVLCWFLGWTFRKDLSAYF